MQDAKGDERCPPPQSTIPYPSPFPSRWRTSFPRLTASRHAEGNENNEIQRSSVTYARRAPSLNSHLYYLSGSKSIHPPPPPPSVFHPSEDEAGCSFTAQPTKGGRNLYPQWNCGSLRMPLINFVQAWLSWNHWWYFIF